jgi:hypothetical protein
MQSIAQKACVGFLKISLGYEDIPADLYLRDVF